MHSISDERNWLTWLVKVRILILMVLLAIELAVIRLTPSPLPIMPFLTGMVLWFVLSLFFLFLVSVWPEHRLQAILQVFADLAMVRQLDDRFFDPRELDRLERRAQEIGRWRLEVAA